MPKRLSFRFRWRLDPPEALRKWLKGFSGEKIVVGEAGSGWVLSALTPEQAARSAQQVAEGEEVRLARPSAAWKWSNHRSRAAWYRDFVLAFRSWDFFGCRLSL